MIEGFRGWLLTEETVHIPKNAIKIALPKKRQQDSYTCGPVSLKAIADYFQVDYNKDYIKLCKTTKENGASPENIAKAAVKIGLSAKLKKGMTIKELINYLRRGIPVICNIQAWGSQKYYKKSESGHYVVSIGFDDKRIYFEDPSVEHPDRGYMPYDDFINRWHDIGVDGKHINQLGIALWKDNPKPDRKKRSEAKKIE